jgi:hypothetical protein
MPLQVPNLDDRTFADLVEEALSLLPQYAPLWTNYNPSDPGITLIELLAYFTEMLIYRLNRVTRDNQLRFLQLLRGAEKWEQALKTAMLELRQSHQTAIAEDFEDPARQATREELEQALKTAVQELRQPQRAVTAEDFEYLARQATLTEPADRQVVRAHCSFGRHLGRIDATSWDRDYPGHVSVVVVPHGELDPAELKSLVKQVRDWLEPRCLLTTRLHVSQPHYLWVSLGAVIHLQGDTPGDAVRKAADSALQRFFSPLPGAGPHGEGWPFGRNLYLSEVIAVLEQVPGVDYVEEVRVLRLATSEEDLHKAGAAVGIQIGIHSTVGVDSRLGAMSALDGNRLLRNESGTLAAVALRPHELVRIRVREKDILIHGSGLESQREI